jgi:hypothetical protein
MKVSALLEKMQSIALDEMVDIHLMERYDLKFVVPVSLLPRLLEKITPHFRVLTINNDRISPYYTQYFDTSDLQMFMMHQNGKLNRQKVRIRSYVNSNLSFLEVKNKNNKGKTLKIRIPVPNPYLPSGIGMETQKQFIDENSLFTIETLKPVLSNHFNRITLVNHEKTERVTIDFDLSFFNHQTKDEKSVAHLLVLELKQNSKPFVSHINDLLNNLHIRPVSFSKYCMGTVLTNSRIKYNRFKPKWVLINKLTQKRYDSI